MERVLVLAKGASTSDRVADLLSPLGIEVSQIKSHTEARKTGSATVYSLILFCQEQEDRDDLAAALPSLVQAWPDTPIALAVPRPSLEFALHAFRLGSFDLVASPLTAEAAQAVLARARAWRQAQLIRKLQHLHQLCGWFAHEVRNPLAGILTSAQVVMEGSGLPAQARGYLKIVMEESLRLERFLQRLVEIGRTPRRQVAPASLNAVVERALAPAMPQMRKQEVLLTWQPGEPLPEVTIDVGQVEHAVTIVISNALETLPSGGELSLLTTYQPGEQVVELEVSSIGDGVKPVDERLLFDPFSSRKSPGRELGLTHALLTFAQHGGSIVCRGEAGHSRTFLLQLPVAGRGARSTGVSAS